MYISEVPIPYCQIASIELYIHFLLLFIGLPIASTILPTFSTIFGSLTRSIKFIIIVLVLFSLQDS
jgi:hypothetical protein